MKAVMLIGAPPPHPHILPSGAQESDPADRSFEMESSEERAWGGPRLPWAVKRRSPSKAPLLLSTHEMFLRTYVKSF